MDESPGTQGQVTRLQTSKLANWSLGLSLILCCPLTSLVSVVLGFMALHRIHSSGGALAGRGRALAAVLIGSAMLIVQSGMLDWFSGYYERRLGGQFINQITIIIDAAEQADIEKASGHWSLTDTDGLDEEAFLDFGRAVADRYGTLDHIKLQNIQPTGSSLAPTSTVAMILDFSKTSTTDDGEAVDDSGATGTKRQVLGHAVFRLVPSMADFLPSVRLIELQLTDKELGDLQLP
ncbi:MAG: hypothetical protein CMJ32_04695 [Phycisphaerae bacterium]|nr:hypothetical protein [Phycisphaerae bacterium]